MTELGTHLPHAFLCACFLLLFVFLPLLFVILCKFIQTVLDEPAFRIAHLLIIRIGAVSGVCLGLTPLFLCFLLRIFHPHLDTLLRIAYLGFDLSKIRIAEVIHIAEVDFGHSVKNLVELGVIDICHLLLFLRLRFLTDDGTFLNREVVLCP